MKNLSLNLLNWLQSLGLNTFQTNLVRAILATIIIIFVAYLGYWIMKRIIIKVVAEVIKRSKNEYDDIFLKKGVFNNLSHLVPALVFYYFIPLVTDNQTVISVVRSMVYIYIIIALLSVANSFLNAINDIYEIISEKKGYKFPIKQYIQVIKIILIVIAIILITSIILSKKPGAIIAGLGAMTAVLMLIFKDAILGFVAGIQLSAYDMVKEGDWITVPSRGIDGDVIDINLSTVKIQNFDKTIATVPTYALVQESFLNWKGMQQAGGRRIKRAIYIDMNSIKIVTPQMLEKYAQIPLLKDFIEQKKEILHYNQNSDVENLLTGNSLTNIEVFRNFIESYIKANFRVFKKYKKQKFVLDGKEIERFVIDDVNDFLAGLDSYAKKFLMQIDGKTVIRDVNKFLLQYSDHYLLQNNYLYKIRKVKKLVIRKGAEVEIEVPEKILVKPGLFCDDMTMLVRELKPTDKGLPLEIYVFAATTDWVEYEKIQADLFEHILAVMPIFELRVYQQVSSGDFSQLANHLRKNP